MTNIFAYEARGRDGAFISGTLAAASRAEAIDALHARTLAVTALVPAGSARGVFTALKSSARASGTTRVALFRSLATLVRAGVGLRRAIGIVVEQCDAPHFRSALSGVGTEIERGERFSDALRRYPRQFPDIVSALAYAGELSGSLDEALERIADLLERSVALRRQVAGALAYPAIVATLAISLVCFLVVGVVPEMATMLRGFGGTLPPATAFLVAVASALREPGVLIGVATGFAATIAGLYALARTPRGAVVADRVRFAIPILGPLARKADVAGCARTLGTTLACGVPLASALEAAASMTRSVRLRRVFAEVGEAVAFGQHVAPTFASSGLFDPIFVGLVRAGEESGTLDAMLVRVAEYFEAEVRTTAATLAAVVEPLLIVFLGGAIAAIVAAVLVPLYSTIGSIS